METTIERHGNMTIYSIDGYVVSEEIFNIVIEYIKGKLS